MNQHVHDHSPHAFWQWFILSEARLRDLEVPDKEARLDDFLDHLQAFCPDLFFAIGGDPKGPLELIITASGHEEAFACVRQVISSAPILGGWQFIGFKPALGFDCVISKGAATIDPRRCWFLAYRDTTAPAKLFLRVACPGYVPENAEDFAFAVWESLDSGLGELIAAERIEDIQVGPVPENPTKHGYRRLAVLREFILSTRPSAGV
jgi:hypothetical protein